jgi:hypothetical protein
MKQHAAPNCQLLTDDGVAEGSTEGRQVPRISSRDRWKMALRPAPALAMADLEQAVRAAERRREDKSMPETRGLADALNRINDSLGAIISACNAPTPGDTQQVAAALSAVGASCLNITDAFVSRSHSQRKPMSTLLG